MSPSGENANLYGYVRVSTKNQCIDRQTEKMRQLKVPINNVFIDKASGANFSRPEYRKLRKTLKKGDILFIDSIDRLGRNWRDTVDEWQYIVHEINADIVSLTDSESFFDSRRFRELGDVGQLVEQYVLSTLAFVADSERRKKKDYQAEGIRAAKERGQHLGRPKITDEQISKIRDRLSEKKYSLDQISKKTSLPIAVVHMLLEQTDLFSDSAFMETHALSLAQIQEVQRLASIRKYPIPEIADDARVCTATVYKYGRTMGII